MIKSLGAGAALVGLGALGSKAQAAAAPAAAPAPAPVAAVSGPFTLPKLPYAYDALEPHIDARTMEIHHSKHHQAYINNANAALKDQAALQALSGIQILQRLPSVPDAIRTAVRNNVGGHVNHSFFWELMGPGATSPSGALAAAIDKGFGSLDDFKTKFAAAATGRFGSGWAWLNVRAGALVIESTANQDSPWSDNAMPVLGLDVWEHAYYLKYQNVRADYVKAFWNVVNWRKVEANFAAASV